MKPLPGRRGILLAKISAVMHFLEPALFGVGLAGGIYLTTHQAGAFVLIDRRGGTSGGLAKSGVLLLVGVTLVAASLLFFHRKGRRPAQRLVAAGAALAFFGIGFAREMSVEHTGKLFGMHTLQASTSFVEDYPARPKIRYVVNRWGLRGGEWEVQKAARVTRVAVVGDSFVFGSGVEDDATIARQLDARLRERFGAAVEVLNLGVPGYNLASHVAMLRVAEEQLGADVLVLCLTLPNDLSAWDSQEERIAHARVGGFSLMSYLFSYPVAVTLWGERNLAMELNARGLALLDEQVSRLAAARGRGAPKPLVVFAYSFDDPRVRDALSRIPGAVLARAVRRVEEHFIPKDGHPTALGNQVFSRVIADAFEPAWIVSEQPHGPDAAPR